MEAWHSYWPFYFSMDSNWRHRRRPYVYWETVRRRLSRSAIYVVLFIFKRRYVRLEVCVILFANPLAGPNCSGIILVVASVGEDQSALLSFWWSARTADFGSTCQKISGFACQPWLSITLKFNLKHVAMMIGSGFNMLTELAVLRDGRASTWLVCY